MPDYVYALHDFLPEHEDEVTFRQGERIEVVERDDMYGDGWWQGRNLAGKVGLFPQSYTTAAPPSASLPPSDSTDTEESQTSSTLQPLREESETSSSNGHAFASANGHTKEPSLGDGEVMKATMTDVQQAIEQLGRNNGGSVRDDRSFSFASTGGGDDTDIDTDTDRETDAAGDDWHRSARKKLAEKARKVVEAQKKKEEEDTAAVRSIAPPIEVELSDESEGEDDEDGHHRHRDLARAHPHIPEEDEDEVERSQATQPGHEEENTSPRMHGELDVPAPDRSQPPTAIADRTFPDIQSVTKSSPAAEQHASGPSLPTPTSPGNSTHAMPAAEPEINRLSLALSSPEKTISQITTTPNTVRDAHMALPSPAASSIGQNFASKHSSFASSGYGSNALQLPSPEQTMSKKSTDHPSEWTVEEVIDWLRSKGFGDDVCDKFIEQEITGDVLLDLDVNLLKSEIGIPAFGKRMRIANCITDLRRPPSVVYSDLPAQSQSISQSQSQPFGHSHSHSQSVHSSAHNSVNSPLYPSGFSHQGLPSSGFGSILSAESPTHTGDLPGTPLSPPGRDLKRVSDIMSNAGLSPGVVDVNDGIRAAMERSAMVGLGVGIPPSPATSSHKSRPAQLMLSPSDSNLIGSRAVGGDIPEETDEERAVVSENEAPSSSDKRRRMFMRSPDSGSSTKFESTTSKNSKEHLSPMASPHPSIRGSSDNPAAVPRPNRRQKSIDSSKSPDRLSLFSSAFNGSIGKSRKPAPRYSSFVDHDTPSEKHSTLNLSRLYGGGNRKTSARPSTSDVSVAASSRELKDRKEKEIEKKPKYKGTETKDEKEPPSPTVLRKRMSVNDDVATRGMQALKPGQSVLEQIGEPDHKGWMRKKGDRYNSWKSRYFVLKGPHLYILKSDDKSETKIKGYINIIGYKVLADENTDPGRYGFRIMHDTDKMHFFSSAEQNVIREWMKAIMKATIGRDYSKAVVSSCNIPTIPLTVAQAMSPAPRPPSPTARAAAQKAHRQENPNQLTSRDARVLMGEMPPTESRPKLEEFFDAKSSLDESSPMSLASPMSPHTPKSPAPARPPREMRKGSVSSELTGIADLQLIDWANSHLPKALRITDPNGSLCGGLALLRLAESIRGKPSSPPVPDSAFPSGPNDDKLDGLFKLFDFLLDNDVKTGSVSINEVRQGQRDKIVQLLRALKSWDDKRKAIEKSLAKGPSVSYWAHV